MKSLILRRQKLERLVRNGDRQAVERIMDSAKKKRNSIDYFLATSVLGLSADSVPESDRDFLHKGWKLAEYREATEKKKREEYRKFYEAAGGLPLTSFDQHTLEKTQLLEKYFPGQFGEMGRQNLRDYKPKNIGATFHNVYKSAKKVLGY
jgi:hypothetical protein